MVGTGSEGDTWDKGLLRYGVLVRYTHPTPEHCGFTAALRGGPDSVERAPGWELEISLCCKLAKGLWAVQS